MRKLLIFAIALAGCSNPTPQQQYEMPPIPVHATAVEVRDVPLFFEAIGLVKPACVAEVKPRVLGLIQQVHFIEGEKIEEGALLYTLEEASYAIRVQEAEAQRDQTLVHLLSAKKKLERYRSLPNQDLIAGVEWDALESAVALHEAVLKADQARLAAAQLDLEHCKIRAPIAGFAGKSALQAGSMVGTNSLVTLMQTKPLYIDFLITEKELREVGAKGAVIKVYAAGKEECLGIGKVTFMDHAIDMKSGMLSARGVLLKEHAPLLPGQTVSVRLYYRNKEKAQLIPIKAIRMNQDGPYIFKIKEDHTVEICSIKLGPEENGWVVIEEGLEGVAQVVTEGQHRLFPGSKIEEVVK